MENFLRLGKMLGIHSAASHIVVFCYFVSSQRPAQTYLARFGIHTMTSVV